MKIRRFLFKLSAGIAPILAVLSMGSPAVSQAASIILVDDGPFADDCGSYNNKPALTDPVAVINGAPTGSTIVICPGTYAINTNIYIPGKKLTIKRAVTGPHSRPVLDVPDGLGGVIFADTSTVTIDGLVIDARGAAAPADYIGMYILRSSGTIKNSTILGPDVSGSIGVLVENSDETKVGKVTISNCHIAGYRSAGVYADGPVSLSVSSSTLDGTNGGLVTSEFQNGVFFDGDSFDTAGPTGSVTKARIINNYNGVRIRAASKVSVSNNVLTDNHYGVSIESSTYRSADNNKVTGNTILSILPAGHGVVIGNYDAPAHTVRKFTVSKNLMIPAQYSGSTAVRLHSDMTSAPTLIGSITGNIFEGIATPYITVLNGPFAGVKESGNDVQP